MVKHSNKINKETENKEVSEKEKVTEISAKKETIEIIKTSENMNIKTNIGNSRVINMAKKFWKRKFKWQWSIGTKQLNSFTYDWNTKRRRV